MATVKAILAKVAKASKKKVAVKKPAAKKKATKKKKRKIVRGVSTYGVQTPLRLVHTTPLGGHVWKDTTLGEYRFAPAGVGKRGNNGDDVNVGFAESLEDAIASLEFTERRMGGRSQNPTGWKFDATNIPNLDACDDEELLAFMEALAFNEDKIMLMASEYAEHKLMAQRLRRKGDIQTAQGHETHCDRIYANIPQCYRW